MPVAVLLLFGLPALNLVLAAKVDDLGLLVIQVGCGSPTILYLARLLTWRRPILELRGAHPGGWRLAFVAPAMAALLLAALLPDISLLEAAIVSCTVAFLLDDVLIGAGMEPAAPGD